jgi:hypothetical protein
MKLAHRILASCLLSLGWLNPLAAQESSPWLKDSWADEKCRRMTSDIEDRDGKDETRRLAFMLSQLRSTAWSPGTLDTLPQSPELKRSFSGMLDRLGRGTEAPPQEEVGVYCLGWMLLRGGAVGGYVNGD